ncbi:MAG: hypothetical protein GXP42_18780, partial [Chloroflexi bacterium]|nr:hypothetical protein [Chloroflexota bacterium]
AAGLRALGYRAHQIAQEHSGVPDLWRRREPPDALIYLDASGPTARRRYPHLDLHDAYLSQERQRLAHALKHADCYIQTDDLTPEQVLERALNCLQALGLEPLPEKVAGEG